MGKAKGSPKTGGRQKGTPNKATQLKQQALQLNQQALMQLVEKYLMSSDFDELAPRERSFKKDFDKLAPRERIDTVIKILAFVIPKPQAVAIDVNAKKKNTIEEKLAELAEEI